MKVSELSSRVDRLVSVATTIKDQSAAVIPGVPPVTPPDDPEVEALAKRIDDAIAVLEGTKSAEPVTPPPNQLDPNAPVTPLPDPSTPVQ